MAQFGTFKYGNDVYGLSGDAGYGVFVDWDNDGDFSDAGENVTSNAISVDIQRGFPDPLERTAKVGRCTIILNNSNRDYSPELDADVTTMRAVIVQMRWDGTTKYKFTGYLENIQPDAGQYEPGRTVKLDCIDAMALLQEAEILIALQENKRGDELIAAIVSNVFTPAGTAYDVDLDEFPFAADEWRDDIVYGGGKQQRALPAIRDVCVSDWGHFYIRADGYPVFENRHHRILDTTVVASFSNLMDGLRYKKGRGLLYNDLKVTAYPRTVGGSNEVLWAFESGNVPSVGVSETVIYSARFRDPNNKSFDIGGKTVVAPAATTDYTMNSAADGSGSDLTANFTVTATVYANHAVITVVNNGASTGYITKLQIRGLAVRVYAPPTLLASDSASQTTYKSKKTLAIDSVLQDDVNVAQQLANYLVGLYGTPPPEITGVKFVAQYNSTFMGYARDLELSTRVTLVETQTGVNGDYFVNFIHETIENYGLWHRVSFDVEPANPGGFFILDVSRLDSADKLAAF